MPLLPTVSGPQGWLRVHPLTSAVPHLMDRCRPHPRRSPSELCYKLPQGVSLEDGAMMEPLAVAVHSVSNIGQFKVGQTIVVMGAGAWRARGRAGARR